MFNGEEDKTARSTVLFFFLFKIYNMKAKKDNEEYIVCAATWFQDGKMYPHQPVYSGLVIMGMGHHEPTVIADKIWEGGQKMIDQMQGFMTNTRRFVDRLEAYEIAVNAGQIKDGEGHLGNRRLDSSDIYSDFGNQVRQETIQEVIEEIDEMIEKQIWIERKSSDVGFATLHRVFKKELEQLKKQLNDGRTD